MPFVALIVGPYSVKGKNNSLIKIFHLKRNTPYSLGYKHVPCTGIRKDILLEIKKLFGTYRDSKDKIDLTERWSS